MCLCRAGGQFPAAATRRWRSQARAPLARSRVSRVGVQVRDERPSRRAFDDYDISVLVDDGKWDQVGQDLVGARSGDLDRHDLARRHAELGLSLLPVDANPARFDEPLNGTASSVGELSATYRSRRVPRSSRVGWNSKSWSLSSSAPLRPQWSPQSINSLIDRPRHAKTVIGRVQLQMRTRTLMVIALSATLKLGHGPTDKKSTRVQV